MVAPAGRWETVADELVDELVEDALRRSFLGGLPRELLLPSCR
jgi:hypothetical protein